MKYFGFDLGDGESAVSYYDNDSAIEPKMIPINGKNSFISAVGVRGNEVLIGEQAYAGVPAEGLTVRFKSRFFVDTASINVSRFAQAVINTLINDGYFHTGDKLYVGCPAGWNASERARYQNSIARFVNITPTIISESRAAFLYAKYSKSIALDIDIMNSTALVIDIGSSTLDYAYIVDGQENEIGTFGETYLGGGLLDLALLRYSIDHSRNKAKINEVLKESRSWYSYCEIEARHLKEDYFIRLSSEEKPQVKTQLQICYDGIQKLTLELNPMIMNELINNPMDELNGISFYQAIRDSICEAKRITEANPPQVVLVTGGASRMSFFKEICKEVFDKSILVECPEPEFSISKGLAYAGWIDSNTEQFLNVIDQTFTEEFIEKLIADHVDDLLHSISTTLSSYILDEVAVPNAKAWKDGSLSTINDLRQAVLEQTQGILSEDNSQALLRPVVEEWLGSIMEDLQLKIDEVCDEYHVPRKQMSLQLNLGNAGSIHLKNSSFISLPIWNDIVMVIISLICAGLCGGTGIAFISTGPIGFLAGAAVGAALSLLGKDVISDLISGINFPTALRHINLEKKLQSEKTKNDMAQKIYEALSSKDSNFQKILCERFSNSLIMSIHETARSAEVAIE